MGHSESGTLVKFRSKFNSCLAMGPYFKDISFLGPYLTLNDSLKALTPLFQFIALRALVLTSRALTSLFLAVYSMIASKGRTFSPPRLPAAASQSTHSIWVLQNPFAGSRLGVSGTKIGVSSHRFHSSCFCFDAQIKIVCS